MLCTNGTVTRNMNMHICICTYICIYITGGAMHPHRAQTTAAAALAAAQEDRKQRRKVEVDRVIMGAKVKILISPLAAKFTV